jgi:hypothetical protein
MLIHTCHAALRLGLEKMFSDWYRRGMACVNQIRPYSVNQMEKSQSKPLAAWHGCGTAGDRHGNGMVRVN